MSDDYMRLFRSEPHPTVSFPNPFRDLSLNPRWDNNGESIRIDEKLSLLVPHLWSMGIRTLSCCQGDPGVPWIQANKPRERRGYLDGRSAPEEISVVSELLTSVGVVHILAEEIKPKRYSWVQWVFSLAPPVDIVQVPS